MSSSGTSKVSADKRSKKASEVARSSNYQSASTDPYGGMLDLQHSAGNQAVNTLVNSLGGGASLPMEMRGEMEQRFGEDFSRVRLHTDDGAAKSADELSAKAYTYGNNIVFNEGRFSPESTEGKRLFAHELAHVVQQSRGGAAPTLDPHAAHEGAAEAAAMQATSESGLITVSGATGVGISRVPDDHKKKKALSSNPSTVASPGQGAKTKMGKTNPPSKFDPIPVPAVKEDPNWLMGIQEQQEYVQTNPDVNRKAEHRRQGPFSPTPGSIQRHGAQEYHWDANGNLVKATSSQLTAGVRDKVMFAKKTGQGPGLDYSHVLGIRFGHVDVRTREYGGFPGPSSLNRPTGEGVSPLWYNAEHDAHRVADNLAKKGKPYLVEVEAPNWKDGRPEKMRIRVFSGGSEEFNSKWIPIPQAKVVDTQAKTKTKPAKVEKEPVAPKTQAAVSLKLEAKKQGAGSKAKTGIAKSNPPIKGAPVLVGSPDEGYHIESQTASPEKPQPTAAKSAKNPPKPASTPSPAPPAKAKAKATAPTSIERTAPKSPSTPVVPPMVSKGLSQPITPSLVRKGLPPKTGENIFSKQAKKDWEVMEMQEKLLKNPPKSEEASTEAQKWKKLIERGEVQPVDPEAAGPTASRAVIRVREGGSNSAKTTSETGSTLAQVTPAPASAKGLAPASSQSPERTLQPSAPPRPALVPKPASTTEQKHTIEPFSQSRAEVNPRATGAGAGAGAAAGAAEILMLAQRDAEIHRGYQEAMRDSAVRTLKWWADKGVYPQAKVVVDHWLDPDDQIPVLANTLTTMPPFDGLEVNKLTEPPQYRSFESWARDHLHNYNDFVRHFLQAQDPGVRRSGSVWEVQVWHWSDNFPASTYSEWEEDGQITSFMEPIYRQLIMQTMSEISDLGQDRGPLRRGRVIGVRQFREEFLVDKGIFSPTQPTVHLSLQRLPFKPLFFELEGGNVPEEYSMVMGADIETYALLRESKIWVNDDQSLITSTESPAKSFSGLRPNVDAIALVKTKSLTDLQAREPR